MVLPSENPLNNLLAGAGSVWIVQQALRHADISRRIVVIAHP
jgi:hypothetical protein